MAIPGLQFLCSISQEQSSHQRSKPIQCKEDILWHSAWSPTVSHKSLKIMGLIYKFTLVAVMKVISLAPWVIIQINNILLLLLSCIGTWVRSYKLDFF